MVLIGCGQLTWNNVSPELVMRQIADAGYDGAPASIGSDQPATEVVAWFGSYGLKPAPPYFSAMWWDPNQADEILARAPDIARRVRALGLTDLYVAADGSAAVNGAGKTRADLAGKVGPDDRLSEEEFGIFGDVLGRFAAATQAEGVTSCFHNHVGTVIETAAELDTLLDHVSGDDLGLGLDTGHIAWAGDNATDVCLRYLDRIRTLHLKDVNGNVRQQGVEADWSYRQFAEAGIFAELREGIVDFPAILTALSERGFYGWLIVETDITMKPSAYESAKISRDYLTSIGY